MRTIIAICFAFSILASNAFTQESPSVQLFEDQQVELKLDSKQEDSVNEPVETEPIKIKAAQLQLITNVEIAAKDAGVIESIEIVEGKKISVGDVIVTLDRDAACTNAEIAESELDIARQESKNDIDLRFAKVSTEVSGKVYQRSVNATKQFAKSVSKTELESLKLEFERAQLSGEQAENTAAVQELTVQLRTSQKELACLQLRDREIKAPVSGLVVQVFRQVGEWVQPGQSVARVIDLSKLRVSCRCYLKDASPEEITKTATFIHKGKEYKARVVFASPEIDPDVQDFIVWAEVENTSGELKPGVRGSMVLQKVTGQ